MPCEFIVQCTIVIWFITAIANEKIIFILLHMIKKYLLGFLVFMLVCIDIARI